MRVALVSVLFAAALAAAGPVFETDILPLFQQRCVSCHTGAKAQAGLDLSTLSGALKGGKSGRAIEPASAARSLLVEKIASGAMPPAGAKLTASEAKLVRDWIDQGARSAAVQVSTGVTADDVLPIFQMRCVVCHGKRKQEGGLDLRNYASQMKGGKSGAAIVPGSPDESLLIKRVAAGEMPPPKLLFDNSVRPPTNAELEMLRRWIAGGAAPSAREAPTETADTLVNEKDREFWSFQPPKRPAVPAVKRSDLVRNPIDAFLLAKLEAKNLSYSPEAPKIKLLRRAYVAVTGMPPASREAEEFLADARPDAFERLIDRLLESPAYGERWGRYWLDAIGYSDSEGKVDADVVRPEAWRYRDYVIRSLNNDKPYDQFLREQVAGDEMVDYRGVRDTTPEVLEKLIATGFWRMAPDGTYSPPQSFLPERMNVIADQIEVFGSAVLGLTINCARCHSHKYDPLPQRDYYRLAAILQSAYDPYDWVIPTKRHLEIGLREERIEAEAHNAPIDKQIKDTEAQLKALGDKPDKAQAERLKKQIADLKLKLKPLPTVRALYDMGGEPSASYLLRRGDALSPGDHVEPGVPAVLLAKPYQAGAAQGDSTGRRLGLAEWLVQPEHPLTARVIVNRIWMHHFGRGIVASVGNFGRTGVPPTHPELLDWLATELVRQKWSMKAIHRLILTSRAWRQTSAIAEGLEATDPENALVSRMPLRRMDADALHDSILKVTARLDPKMLGPAAPVDVRPDGEVVAKGGAAGFRRAVYVLQRRRTPVTMLEIFDTPPMAPNCIERPHSTVATQALQLFNAVAMTNHARHLAGRVIDTVGDDVEKQVEQVYLRVLVRPATRAEVERGVKAIRDFAPQWKAQLESNNESAPAGSTSRWMALADLIHVLLNSAEFAYVD